MTKNLTQGNISKQLLALALPLIVGNILQQLYNTIDALVAGRFIGTEAFAAVGVAGTVMNLFIFILSGACAGVGIIWAQFYGQKDWRSFRSESFLALAAGSAFTLLLSAIGWYAAEDVLMLIATPLELMPFLKIYLQIIFGGLLTTFLYNYCSALLRAVGNTAMALLFLAVAMLLNLLLDLLFVAVLQWGIGGAAWATVLAQLFSVFCCYLYLWRSLPHLLWRKRDVRLDGKLLRRTCCYALATAAHNSNLYIGKLAVQGAVNGCGVDMVAAYTAAGRLEGFINSFGDSGTASLNIFIAQNCGALRHDRVKRGFFTGLKLLALLGAVSSVLLYVAAPAGIAFMLGTNTGEGWRQGVEYMQTVALFYFLCFAGNALAGYFEGCGQLVIPAVGATGHIALRAALAYAFIYDYGLISVAYATGIGWLAVVCFWSWLARRRLCAAPPAND